MTVVTTMTPPPGSDDHSQIHGEAGDFKAYLVGLVGRDLARGYSPVAAALRRPSRTA
jgi:hypothetical protein